MGMVFDNYQPGQPGLHAFIAGTSFYPHLPDGNEPPTPYHFGMKQLHSTSVSAYKVYEWLLSRQNRFPVPLASIHLLLSPSVHEMAAYSGLATLKADPCTRHNFAVDAANWREVASSNRKNYTFFYFAGHGIRRSISTDAIMLMEDYGDNSGAILMNAVEVADIVNGMTPCDSRPEIARIQLYFIDCCRVLPAELQKFPSESAQRLWSVEENQGTDDRSAPIFYAAIPGAKAPADARRQTFFSKMLLDCLNNDAGDIDDETGLWQVSVHSLIEALEKSRQQLQQDIQVTQELHAGGQIRNEPIHYLDAPPRVIIEIEVNPDSALPFTQIEMLDSSYTSIGTFDRPLKPHPYEMNVAAGYYSINGVIVPEDHPLFRGCHGKVRRIMPPGRKVLKVNVE